MITFAPEDQWETAGNVQVIGSTDKTARERIWLDLRTHGNDCERRCHRSTEIALLLKDGLMVRGDNQRAVYITYYTVTYHRR